MNVTQTDFRHALMDPARPAPDGLKDGHGAPAGRRFSVYRNNVAVSLADALQTAFPTVAKLIGEENFRKVAGLFLRAHPPASPLMMQYGAEFADFLAGFGPLAHIGYLPDMARLDHALRLSYHAADATPLRPEALAAIPPDALSTARLRYAPAVRLLRSDWPIHAIYRFNHEPGAPKPKGRAEDVLIARPEFDPVPHPLPPDEAAFVAATMKGAGLEDAADRATGADGTFDPTAIIALLVSERCLTDVEV